MGAEADAVGVDAEVFWGGRANFVDAAEFNGVLFLIGFNLTGAA